MIAYASPIAPPVRAVRAMFIDQSGDAAGGAEESLALLLAHLSPEIIPTVMLFGDGAFAARLRREGVRVIAVATPGALTRAQRESFGVRATPAALAVLARIIVAIRTERPHVVYTNTVKAHVLGALAARLTGTPLICHDRDLLEGTARNLVRWMGRGSQRVAITRAVADWYGLPDTQVVAEPLDLGRATARGARRQSARAKLGLPAVGPIVAMVGRINRWKGHDRFIAAARIVSGEVPDAHFAIVGAPVFRDADFAAELRMAVECGGIASRVTFVPWVDDVSSAYDAIDLHCNCSTREPFGRTTIEAALHGVPTVCFADGGAAEAMIPGQTGISVPPSDIAGLATAILTYLRDPERRGADGERARNYVERYDAREHGRQIGALILATAKPGRRG